MTKYVYLIGAEEVPKIGNAMSAAVDTIQRAVGSLEEKTVLEAIQHIITYCTP